MVAVIGHREARAESCPTASPACHLENGKQLLRAEPRRAADELLASYQLDERTDTLVLYATALQLDHRYALALETWKRVIVFRDSEVETAKETARATAGRRRAAARAAQLRAEKQSAEAADAILQLWTKVGYARVRLAPGQRVAVTRDGAEVDASQDVVVNAGRDELVFTGKDGRVERVVVEVSAGGLVKIDAPSESLARTAPPSNPQSTAPPKIAARPKQPPVTESARPAPLPVPPPRVPDPAASAKPPTEADQAEPTLTAERFVDAPRSRTLSRVGLGLGAGAIAVGGVAAGFAYLASRDYDESRAAGCSVGGQCPFGPAADLARQSNDRARIAQLGAIGAGVLAATGVTLWFVGRSKTRHPVADLALHIGPSSTAMSGASAALSGRF